MKALAIRDSDIQDPPCSSSYMEGDLPNTDQPIQESHNSTLSRVSSWGLAFMNAIICRKKRDFQTYSEAGLYFKKITILDYGIVTVLRVFDVAYHYFKNRSLVDQESLKTHRQKKHERRVTRFRNELGAESVYSNFSKEVALLIHELFPKCIGEQMSKLPAFTETYILFQMGVPFRYLNHKVNQHTDHRNYVITSKIGGALSRVYCAARYRLVHTLLSPQNVTPILNFEHTFLELCTKIRPHIVNQSGGSTFGNVVIESLGRSLSLIEKADEYLKDKSFDCPKDSFIARLNWYSQNDVLPKGMPDPKTVSLTDSNLDEKLDEAMYDYLNSVSEILLEKIVPKKIKSKFVRFVYFMEGKDFLKKILSNLLGELVVKQVADPHLFAMAILAANGIETADFELDGFGRGTKDAIQGAGREILKNSSKEGVWPGDLSDIFERSKLKSNARSCEGIEQKKEVKEKLKKFIEGLLYQSIKGEDFTYESWFKDIRKYMQELPLVSVAVTSFHILFSAPLVSLEYFIRDTKYNNMGFPTWFFKKISGKGFYKSIASAIVDIIYDPSWRFIALHLIESIVDKTQNRTAELHNPNNNTSEDYLYTICRFAFTKLTKNMEIPPTFIFDRIVTPDVLNELRKNLKPSETPFPEVIMQSLLPILREYMLYYRLTEHFRMNGVHFEGDGKFWEVYIREFLNDSVDIYIKQILNKTFNLSNKALLRAKFVNILLQLNGDKLVEHLANGPQDSPLQELPETECLMFLGVNDQKTIDEFLQEDYSGLQEGSSEPQSVQDEDKGKEEDWVIVRGPPPTRKGKERLNNERNNDDFSVE